MKTNSLTTLNSLLAKALKLITKAKAKQTAAPAEAAAESAAAR